MLLLRNKRVTWVSAMSETATALQLLDEHDVVVSTLQAASRRPVLGPSATIRAIRLTRGHTVETYYGDNIRTVPVGPDTLTVVFDTSGPVASYGAYHSGGAAGLLLTPFNSLTYPAPMAAAAVVTQGPARTFGSDAVMLHNLLLASLPSVSASTLLSLRESAAVSEDLPQLDLAGLASGPMSAAQVGYTSDGPALPDDNDVYDMVANVLTYAQCQTMQELNKDPKFSQSDLSKPDVMLDYIRSNASGTLHYFNEKLRSLGTNISMATDTKKNTYSEATVNLGFLTDLFASFDIPEANLKSLQGLVTSFAKSIQDLTSTDSSSSAKTGKLVVMSKLSHPAGDVTLNRTGTLTVMFVDFLQAAHEWSNFCGSGRSFELQTTVTSFEMDLNRQLLIKTAPMFSDWAFNNAKLLFDAGASDVSKI